jgi:hypothetical protein
MEAELKNQDRFQEELQLLEYVRNVSEEPWAKDNSRLETFIKQQLKKGPPKKPKQSTNNTTSRLGFANTGYTKMNVAGTNEITRGLLSTVNIEFNS